jgi:hypothetical protein
MCAAEQSKSQLPTENECADNADEPAQGGETLATEMSMAVVRAKGLTDIEFTECGTYV